MWKTAFSICGKEDSVKETQEGCLSRAIITNFVACKDNKICKPGEYMSPGLAKELPAKLRFASGETHLRLPSFYLYFSLLLLTGPDKGFLIKIRKYL